MNHARAGQRQQGIVDDGEVIGRDDGAALTRNVLKSLRGRPQTMDGDRTQTFDEKPVEHSSRSSQRIGTRPIRV